MQFYRFRNMKYLLEDKYQELKRQEIYLSSPEQLNDPNYFIMTHLPFESS